MGSGGPLQNSFSRYGHGDDQPRLTPDVASADVIEQGDIVRLDGGIGGAPKSIESITIPGVVADALAGRILTHNEFYGVSSQRSRDGETRPVRCITRGVTKFKAAPGTYELGGLVGPHSDGAKMLSDTVVPVSAAGEAIGRVVRGHNDTAGMGFGLNPPSVLVEIFSTLTDRELA